MWAGGTIPPGWHRFTALDGLFPRGAATYGGTGGSESHTHAFSGTTDTAEDPAVHIVKAAGDRMPTMAHYHQLTGTTDVATHLPPYLDIIFIQKD